MESLFPTPPYFIISGAFPLIETSLHDSWNLLKLIIMTIDPS